MELEGL